MMNYLKYMDHIKIFAYNDKEQRILVGTVRIYCQETKIEFGIEKHTMHIIKRWNRNHRLNRSDKSGKHENTRGKRKQQIPGNIRTTERRKKK